MWPRPLVPEIYKMEGIEPLQWTDWHWQLSHTIKSAEQLQHYACLTSQQTKNIKKVIEHRYQNGQDQMRLTPYLLSLMNTSDQRDPISLQHLPSLQEMDPDTFSFDKIWENQSDFGGDDNRFLQQKYPDVVLLRLSNTCHSFCRFCFEKERTLRGGVKTVVGDKQFNEAMKNIRRQKLVRQVLLSGGDPLVLPNELLQKRLQQLFQIPHISAIRINTRTLLHNPYRITKEFTTMLGSLQKKVGKNLLKKALAEANKFS